MNFELGFYRTRDGSIVELIAFSPNYRLYKGRLIQLTSIPIIVKNQLFWNQEGNSVT